LWKRFGVVQILEQSWVALVVDSVQILGLAFEMIGFVTDQPVASLAADQLVASLAADQLVVSDQLVADQVASVFVADQLWELGQFQSKTHFQLLFHCRRDT